MAEGQTQYKARTDLSLTSLVGRITRKHYSKGNGKASVLRLTVACGEAVGPADNRRQETAWIPVVVFGNSADALDKMIPDVSQQGSMKPRCAVQGRLRPGQARRVTVNEGGAEFDLRELELIVSPFGLQLLDFQSNGDAPAQASEPQPVAATSDDEPDF